MTFKLMGHLDEKGMLILDNTKSYFAQMVAIPVYFTEYKSDALMAVIMQKVNDKLMRSNNAK